MIFRKTRVKDEIVEHVIVTAPEIKAAGDEIRKEWAAIAEDLRAIPDAYANRIKDLELVLRKIWEAAPLCSHLADGNPCPRCLAEEAMAGRMEPYSLIEQRIWIHARAETARAIYDKLIQLLGHRPEGAGPLVAQMEILKRAWGMEDKDSRLR